MDEIRHANVRRFELTPELVDSAESQMTGESVVPPFWREKYERENAQNWNRFYTHNQANFFKDRHYIANEFGIPLLGESSTAALSLVDMGCGVGNALVPLLQDCPCLTAVGFDCSRVAIDLLQERLNEGGLNFTDRCSVFVLDASVPLDASETSLTHLEGTADYVLLLFVLSSISPEHYATVRRNAWRFLKPGGSVLLRDYGKYDMAQLRFEMKSGRQANRIADDFYVRGDGTRAKFYSESELRELWEAPDELFQPGEVVMHTKAFTNRKTEVEMKRVWVQGKWQKTRI